MNLKQMIMFYYFNKILILKDLKQKNDFNKGTWI